MKFAVVDDDQLFLNQISSDIKYLLNQRITIDCYQNALEFYSESRKIEYDAYFIDIDMPVVNGFELSRKLLADNDSVPVIYVTGRDELIIQAFRYKVLGFVRKCNLSSELKYAINTLMQELKVKAETLTVTEIQLNGGKEYKIPVESIEFVQTEGHNTVIHLNDKNTITVRKPISFYCESKLFERFAMIDSGTLVNLKMITFTDNKVTFLDGKTFSVSKRRCKAVYEAWLKSRRRLLV